MQTKTIQLIVYKYITDIIAVPSEILGNVLLSYNNHIKTLWSTLQTNKQKQVVFRQTKQVCFIWYATLCGKDFLSVHSSAMGGYFCMRGDTVINGQQWWAILYLLPCLQWVPPQPDETEQYCSFCVRNQWPLSQTMGVI